MKPSHYKQLFVFQQLCETGKLLTQKVPHEKFRSALNCGPGGGTDRWRHPSITFFPPAAPHFSTVRIHQRHYKALCAVDKGHVVPVMSLSKSTTPLAVSKNWQNCTD